MKKSQGSQRDQSRRLNKTGKTAQIRVFTLNKYPKPHVGRRNPLSLQRGAPVIKRSRGTKSEANRNPKWIGKNFP